MAKYTEKLGDQICKLTATTTFGLRHICKQLRLPYSTVSDWVYDRGHDIYLKYKQAKVDQLTCLADEIIELMNDTANDYITVVTNGKSKQVQNRECLARTRLKINTTMMLITKLKPVMEKELQDLHRKKHHNTPRPIPDTQHARQAMSMPPAVFHTHESKNTLSSAAPKSDLKPASGKPLPPEASPHLNNTSLPLVEGRGEATSGEAYTIHPDQWAKMNKRERRVAMLEYSSKLPLRMPYNPRHVRELAEQLKKEKAKTAKQKRQEDEEDLKQQRIDEERNILPQYDYWYPLPGGGFGCKNSAIPRPVSNYRWVSL